MKIGISTLGIKKNSGSGTHLSYLLKYLKPSKKDEIESFGLEKDRLDSTQGTNIPFSSVRKRNFFPAFYSLKSFCLERGYDAIFFIQNPALFPITFGVPSVAFVNTLEFIEESTSITKRYLAKLQLLLAKKIIASSRFIADSLAKNGIDKKKITVIYGGVDTETFHPTKLSGYEEPKIEPFSVTPPYILYASNLSTTQKNHAALIKAFTIFKKRALTSHKLVLSGAEEQTASLIYRAVRASPFARDIFITGYFPHSSLSALYASSDMVIIPSSREGEGLSLLEAMATGVPVAAANKGALPEIGGDGVLFFNPENTEETVNAMMKIMKNKELAASLSKNALSRASLFSWKENAKLTLQTIRSEFEL